MSVAGKVFIAIGILLILFAVAFFLGSFDVDPGESNLAGIILLGIGLVFVTAGIYTVSLVRRATYLLTEGIDGRAKVLEWWLFARSGGAISYSENCEFELEVSVAGYPPYTVNHRQRTPLGIVNRLSKGMWLPVKVHPEKPKQLIVVWEEVEDKFVDEEQNKALKDRLRELDSAYQDKLISKEIYENKRAEILRSF